MERDVVNSTASSLLTLTAGNVRMEEPETWGVGGVIRKAKDGVELRGTQPNGHRGDESQGIRANEKQPWVSLQAARWPVKGNRCKASRRCNPACQDRSQGTYTPCGVTYATLAWHAWAPVCNRVCLSLCVLCEQAGLANPLGPIDGSMHGK